MLWVVLAIASILAALWTALGLHFAGPRPPALANGLAVALAVVVLVVLLRVRPLGRATVMLAVVFGVWALWWSTIAPRNDRDWQPDVAELPSARLDGDRLTITNLRNFDYRSETDYTPHWETRTFDLAKLAGLDLFMSFWGAPVAHTIMSWDFTDGQHLAISIETRKEKGEEYSAVAGFFKQYELYYVVADERDVIRLRTNYRKEEVHLYPMRTPLARARRILLDYVDAMNQLVDHPEFYNAATANCTTSITRHIRNVGIGMNWDYRLLLNGNLDQLLYEQGVIDVTHPFPEVRQASLINPRAEVADQDPAFSARIREGLVRPPLLVLPPGAL